ncbi:enoyl-CoA hydratase-related protein [Paraliomyxa miuraensis]|nr:enoyl-CoA hydratase-related protein [Paraliomyxa miuraensis]MCX4244678.1 enoyl-CoA hydratase-related protein [Paraliomyxa miuraensis]
MIRVVTIDRPKVLNALSEEVVGELTAVVEDTARAFGAGASVRGLLLTGEGKAFVAGADIAAMADMTPEQALAFSGKGHALGEMLEALPVPTVAAVNGFALGGGCELALACDFIYASEKAKFGQPEVKLAVIPGFGGTQRLLRRVGLARALELCMTGDMIDAAEAHRIGLANRVLPPEQLLDEAMATLVRIAAQGPLAVAKAKEVLHRGASMPLTHANDLEQEAFASLFASADQTEGMHAFLAKRAANFTGR